MIIVTYDPMEGVLVVAAGPRPMGRYIWGDVETLARGKYILEACTKERGEGSTRDTLEGLDLGGSFLPP
jgi:hypothetical protein